MSPLVCSLLALTALLACTHAYRCRQKMLGYATTTIVTVPTINTPPLGDVLEIAEDYELGSIVGEKIVACNKNPDGRAPMIEVSDDPPDFAAVTVACYADFCPDGATVNITQFYEDFVEMQ